MKKTIKKVIATTGKSVAMLALFIGILTSNSACYTIWHQPKEPEIMEKFKF